jgi:hypothetical protein
VADYLVEERGGRYFVVSASSGQEIYTPPTFLSAAVQCRADLQPLADALNGGDDYIDAVMAFEDERWTGLRQVCSTAAAAELALS